MRCTLDITARPANYGIGRRDVVFDKCRVDIDYTDFDENHIVKVLAVRDCQEDGFYTTTVDITPSSQCSVAVVQGYKETITISVVDVNCGHCYGTGDPHYVTFDGSSYDWYGVGDFVLFESPYNNFQVQVRTWKCWSVTCNCGIAIKEANDVITVDMCHGNFGKSSPRVRKPSEGKLVHGNKVYKHLNGKEFLVQMSSQRSVRVSADRYRLNIFLDIPSDDFNRSRGLCGTFDGHVTNDFTDRDGRVLQYVGRRPDSFSESWRVTNGESLFDNRPDDVIYSDQEFCACESSNKDCRKNIKEHADQLNRPQQEWVDITEELNDSGDRSAFSYSFYAKQRQENNSDDALLSGYTYYQDPDFLPRILTWPTRSGITEQQARDICTSAVQNSDSATSCSDVQEVDLFIGRDACVEDIGFSDSLLFLCDVVSIMEKHCEDVSLKNLTLYQKDINGKIIAPPSFLTSSMCPFRCGDHGYCTNGKYHCHEGYGGTDCSIDLNEPPTIWYVNGAEHSFCDVREEDCQSINVIGDNILNSDKLKCQLEETESLERYEKVLSDAHFQTFSEITCSLPVAMVNPGDPDDAGVTFKTVAVYLSNDNGNSASNALRFTIFDSKCRLCNGTDNCSLKPNTCDINGHCYMENESHHLNTDKKCVPDVDQYKWTVTSGQDSNKGAVVGAIIGGTLCTISAAAIVSVTGYMYFTRRWIFSSFRKKKVYPQTLQSNGEKSLDSWHSKSHMQMTGHK
ncbi:von Willebrand factor D and EGF domain-containing protein-like [Ptychodera flava]|uniref:von Willebrand factor D and EGF domain-containing protein-like n=1 Tax=Ptychodera flava TaxID=63121 RepID=UPI00396A382F